MRLGTECFQTNYDKAHYGLKNIRPRNYFAKTKKKLLVILFVKICLLKYMCFFFFWGLIPKNLTRGCLTTESIFLNKVLGAHLRGPAHWASDLNPTNIWWVGNYGGQRWLRPKRIPQLNPTMKLINITNLFTRCSNFPWELWGRTDNSRYLPRESLEQIATLFCREFPPSFTNCFLLSS